MKRYGSTGARPTSFRLPEDILKRLDEEARRRSTTVTSTVTQLLDEGLKIRRFPGIIYRDGPAGRRAALAGGPDVWEIVRELRSRRGGGERAVRDMAEELGLALGRMRVAIDFYSSFPNEIDERIELDERAAEEIRAAVERRESLLSA